MAKMLGNVPNGRYSCCKCLLCGRKPSEDVEYRRNQRARERDRFLREAFDEAADAREDDHADLIEHLMSEHL